jgi:putative membrane protein
MKNLTIVGLIALAAYVLQGCNNAPKGSTANADSLNKTKDTTKNAAATGGMAVDSADAAFATVAAADGMAEVALGKLAAEKSTNSQIKNFGDMMVTDHSKAGDELKAIAKTKNITLPDSLDDAHKKKIADLSKKSGKDFDKAYVDAMVDGHKKALDLMQSEAKNGKDADLTAFAAKTAKIVQMHLDAINKIHDSMK